MCDSYSIANCFDDLYLKYAQMVIYNYDDPLPNAILLHIHAIGPENTAIQWFGSVVYIYATKGL
jgi:hypothetical protein